MRKAIVEGNSSMDVSISKRVMLLFGLLRAGALMCASALFLPECRFGAARRGERQCPHLYSAV